MIFQVINSNKVCVMTTSDPKCIPFSDIDDMHKAGYTFKVDGKVVTKKNLLSSFSSYNSATVSSVSTKAVRCIETGEVYDTQSQAARALGIDPAQVSDSIKTGRPRSGYRFERVRGAS